MGHWLNGKKNGEGTFFYPDGSKHEGNWVNDQRQGWGTYTYPNGDTYEGEWANNQRHGQGVYSYASTGSRYEGTWFHGKMEGPGELIHANHRFIGGFVSGLPMGRGSYRFDGGSEQRGRYEHLEEEVLGDTEEDTEIITKPVWKVDDIIDAQPVQPV